MVQKIIINTQNNSGNYTISHIVTSDDINYNNIIISDVNIICNNDNLNNVEFEGEGVIIGFTEVVVVPSTMSKAGFGADNPYWTCIISIEEGVNIPAVLDLTGFNDLKNPFIGMHVKVEFGCKNEIYFKPL